MLARPGHGAISEQSQARDHMGSYLDYVDKDPYTFYAEKLGHMPRSHRPLNVVVSRRQILTSV
jgi:hypothetical protein